METDKPPYLGLLNRITLAERNAGQYLAAWAAMTPDPDFARVLGLVAARETTHGEVFRQRIERLGFAVREQADPALAERLRVYRDPRLTDADKIQAFRRTPEGETAVDEFFASLDAQAVDPAVDALTRDTLRWFVAEERDSRALLRAAYARVEAALGVAR